MCLAVILQAKASWQFLNVLRTYLESLCSDLRYHTITNVQSDNDRVSIIYTCVSTLHHDATLTFYITNIIKCTK
jgi:hypothetical protein